MCSILWLAFIEKLSSVHTALLKHIKLWSGLYKHHGKLPIFMIWQEVTKRCLQEKEQNVNINVYKIS